MSVVRTPMLQPGFYWFDDIAKPGRPTSLAEWIQKNRGLVVVRSTVTHLDETPPRAWYLFEVKFPALWDDRLGFPSTATATTTEQDTTTNTPTPSPSFDLSSLFGGGSSVLLLVGLVWALSSERR